jgi:hypothetical protein
LVVVEELLDEVEFDGDFGFPFSDLTLLWLPFSETPLDGELLPPEEGLFGDTLTVEELFV